MIREYRTYVVECDSRDCFDCCGTTELASRKYAASRAIAAGWMVDSTGHALCPKCFAAARAKRDAASGVNNEQ